MGIICKKPKKARNKLFAKTSDRVRKNGLREEYAAMINGSIRAF
jgi:hypothetical protein